MADRTHRGLPWPEWGWRMDQLARASASADSQHQAGQLRDFHDLVANAPDLMLLDGITVPSLSQLVRLIGCGACDSAALAFVGPSSGCMISRGADGFHFASIALPGHQAEASASGATLALAVLAALAAAIGNAAARRPAPGRLQPPASHLLH